MIFSKLKFYAFMNGAVVPLKDVNDPVFSAGMAGQGVAIDPADGKVYAPVNGSVSMVFPTHHAIGLTTKEGDEVIVHIGIDTVNLKGDGFTVYVKEGQKVKSGDLLMEADLKKIREAGYDPTSMLVVNAKQLDYKKEKGASVKAGKDVLFVKEK